MSTSTANFTPDQNALIAQARELIKSINTEVNRPFPEFSLPTPIERARRHDFIDELIRAGIYDIPQYPRDRIYPDASFEIVRGWLKTGRVSLVAGASGAGKSSFMFPLLEAIRLGEPYFGHETESSEYRVLGLDRDRGEVSDTTRRVRCEAVLDRFNYHEKKRGEDFFAFPR